MTATKVAVLASSEDQRNQLHQLLEQSGLDVVFSEDEGESFLNKLNATSADVLLVDIGESDEDVELIDLITDKSELPILFNDSGPDGVKLAISGSSWAKKLAQKLEKMANKQNNSVVSNGETPSPAVQNTDPILKTPSNAVGLESIPTPVSSVDAKSQHTIRKPLADLNIWVLGASLGGPQAVRQFLASINPDLPVAFILAQHIGANHVTLLAEQLNRVTKFNVLPGKTGHRLRHHEVILTPADKQLSFTEDGFIALKPSPPAAVYSPSIDNVMHEVARNFGEKAGTIIFSGMGDDGAKGCESIAQSGGIVWAQDIASCVVSSMPDSARSTGVVSFSATPEQLAIKLYEYYR